MLKPIYDITSYTLVDYPNHSSCVIWFSGCNLKCQYCYNQEILPFNSGTKDIDELFKFLDTRKGLLDAVVLSGGEATLFKDIISLCEKIKAKGFKIKLDTNGTNPKIIEELLQKNLINFISLDIKAATKEKFNQIVNLPKSNLVESLYATISILKKYSKDHNFNYECRTTVHSDFFEIDEIIECIDLVYNYGYRNKYALQLALDDVNTLNNLTNTKKYNKEVLIDKSKLQIDFRNFAN